MQIFNPFRRKLATAFKVSAVPGEFGLKGLYTRKAAVGEHRAIRADAARFRPERAHVHKTCWQESARVASARDEIVVRFVWGRRVSSFVIRGSVGPANPIIRCSEVSGI